MKKTKLVTAALTASALSLTACGGGNGDGGDNGEIESQTLSVAIYLAENASQAQAIVEWGDNVTEATDGAIEFDFHYNGSLLAGDDTLQGVGDGRADMGMVGAQYYESQLPLTSIATIPYLAPNPHASYLTYKQLHNEMDIVEEEYRTNNVHPIFFIGSSNVLLGAVDETPMTIEDLEGRQIRASGAYNVALDVIGANPVSIGFNEVYESLDRGVIDSFSGIVLDSMEHAGLYEVAPYVSNPEHGLNNLMPISMNLDVWESLDEEVQQIMEEQGEQAVEEFFPIEAEAQASACDLVEEAGGEVRIWEEEETQRWEDALGDTLLDQWRERVGDNAAEFEETYFATLDELDEELGEPIDGVEECASRFE